MQMNGKEDFDMRYLNLEYWQVSDFSKSNQANCPWDLGH